MVKRIFVALCLLTGDRVLGDTHIDKKVSVKEVVFDSPVADIVWLDPDNRVVLARSHNGMETEMISYYPFACRSSLQKREQRRFMEGHF
jgi:hypothetical protein